MTSAPAPSLLPVRLQLHGRQVVVVGGGPAAYRAVVGLLDTGAAVRVVSPAVVPALEALAASGALSWDPRPYAAGDLDAAWYAVAASQDALADEAVAADADRARVFCTRSDDPSTSSARPALPETEPPRAREGGGGRVVLVGGGPGDPGLITVRGRQALSEADVVVVDHLGPRSLLAGLRPDVEVVDASKLPRGRAMPQEQINSLLVAHARAGRSVVRLKGGDPFVFGRGMEELLACAAADVPVEVVPGVTSAVAVPGVAGIPVTHRGLTHEFVVVSGHLPPGHPQSLVEWSALGRLRGTIVVLMGVENAALIAAALIDSGRPPGTPVAVVIDGSTAHQRTVRTTLERLGEAMAAGDVRPPAVWIAGEVADLVSGAEGDRAPAPADPGSSVRSLQRPQPGETAGDQHGGTTRPVPCGADVGLRRSAGSDGRDVPAPAHADARTPRP